MIYNAGRQHFGLITEKGAQFIERARELSLAEAVRERGKGPLGRLLSQREFADLVGRSTQQIRRAQKEERLEQPEYRGAGNNPGYTVRHVLEAQEAFGTRPWRDPKTDKPLIITVINFKGGAGKTQTSSHMGRHLALKGYRVLMVDADAQASLTAAFGFLPDLEFTLQDTFAPYLMAEQDSLHHAIKKTEWPNIDIIPSCLDLGELDLWLAVAQTQQQASDPLDLRDGLAGVAADYDVVIVDTPPSLSMLTTQLIAAADGLVVPLQAASFDFVSTVQFFSQVLKVLELLETTGTREAKRFDFFGALVTRYDSSKGDSVRLLEELQKIYGTMFMQRVWTNMTVVEAAAQQGLSVYELDSVSKPQRESLIAVFGQIEEAIRRCWPSKRSELEREGIITASGVAV